MVKVPSITQAKNKTLPLEQIRSLDDLNLRIH